MKQLKDKEFLDTIDNLDLFCFAETHINPEFSTNLKCFKSYKSCRQTSGNNKFSGGLCLFINRMVCKGVKVFKNDNPEILWVKLNRAFFNFKKDLYICFNYISPDNSVYHRRLGLTSDLLFDQVRQDIADLRVIGYILLLGDMNENIHSKTQDYIDLENIDNSVPLLEADLYQPAIPTRRNTQELKDTDCHGEILTSLCQSSSLRILNGRCRGDFHGKFTRVPANEQHKPSVLDYAISDTEIFRKVKYFNVSHLTSTSDH